MIPDPPSEGVKKRRRKKKVHNSKGASYDSEHTSDVMPNAEALAEPTPVLAVQTPPNYDIEHEEDDIEQAFTDSEILLSSDAGDEEVFSTLHEEGLTTEQLALQNNGQYAYTAVDVKVKKNGEKITIPKSSRIVISNEKQGKKYKILYSYNPHVLESDNTFISSKKCMLTGLDTQEAEQVDYDGVTGSTSETVLDGMDATKDVYDNFIGNEWNGRSSEQNKI